MKEANYKRLIVWKKADELAFRVYQEVCFGTLCPSDQIYWNFLS